MEINNPAGRLLKIIKKSQKEGTNTASGNVFAKLFNIDPNDKALLLRRIGDLMSLPHLIRSEVDKLENISQPLLLKWLPPVELSLETINLKAKWQNFMGHYKEDVIYGMEMCADVLSRNRPEKALKEEDRKKLILIINDAINSLENEDMPEEIKEFFFERLQRVRDALEAYIILGVNPIENEILNIKGVVTQDKNLYYKTHDTNAGKIFWSAMGRVAAVMTILSSTLNIGMDVNEILADNNAEVKMIEVFAPNKDEITIAQIEHKNT